jgi:hypothetical protein
LLRGRTSDTYYIAHYKMASMNQSICHLIRITLLLKDQWWPLPSLKFLVRVDDHSFYILYYVFENLFKQNLNYSIAVTDA